LDKLLSLEMNLSRADARRLITSGCVQINGAAARTGDAKVDTEKDDVRVEGKPVCHRAHLYIVMNKPVGYVCSTDDPRSPTVLELLPPEFCRRGIFPAGRLDKNSEGMLILTDDGDFAHRMLAPKRHLPKVYRVQLDAPVVNEELVRAFARGMSLGGADFASPAVLEPVGEYDAKVTIFEGRYHQVRRMFGRYGARVLRLERLAIGGLALDGALVPGQSRLLTGEEIRRLFGD
jgi:16S rRNA pseudouridine516 synthase